MELSTRKMTDEYAIEILGWKYESPYDLYNNVLSGEAILELTRHSYKAILSDEKVVGFFCTGKDAQVPAGHEFGAYKDDCIDIGLGMRPDLTGNGLGSKFLHYILEKIQHEYDGCIRLTVADFNKRAIHLYEKFNFVKKQAFLRKDMKFIVMVKED
ncbi:GNAT family N-acetyltransferase [Paucisalibacillus sp. EB02]|uniref:GNAT family N-acetyltransferase n=1 Tax=Paucisalibacillus sp. EB02 TaxID=1347087 RepID=UPI0005A7F743|nr:GNAT family N-acetyltransferase [Paucisalibacillus sp. EB02]